MHRKDIKRTITKQLKKKHPDWKKMTRKEKKELARQVMQEVVDINFLKKNNPGN